MEDSNICKWLARAITGSKAVIDLPNGKSVTIQVLQVSTDPVDRISVESAPRSDDFRAFMHTLWYERTRDQG